MLWLQLSAPISGIYVTYVYVIYIDSPTNMLPMVSNARPDKS